MKHRVERFVTPVRILLILALVGAALLAGGPVLADEGHEEGEHAASSEGPTITLELPPEMAVGKEATLSATLSGSGPLAGAEVMFLATLTFAGTEGEVVLGRAVTDDQGIARLTYLPRTQGDVAVTARFEGNGQLGPDKFSQTVAVQPGPSIYQETAGVRIPGLGVWLLLAVLGTVWSTYLTVAVIVGVIAKKGLTLQPKPTLVREPARVAAGIRGAAHD